MMMNTITNQTFTMYQNPMIGCQTMKNSSNVEMKVSYILRQLGIGSHFTGYHYIKRAVEMVMNDKSYCILITKRLYPDIAKEFGTSSTAVERLIRSAIQHIDCDNNIKSLFIGYAKETYTNKEFIMSIAELLEYDT